VKYVSGEIKVMLLANAGISLKGTKMPLMNMSGNFTKELIIWEYCGALAGGEEIMSDAVAKQIEPRIMATTSINGFTTAIPMARAMIIGTMDMIIPVSIDASISPKRIVQTATGQEISRSSVLACVSQGKVIGAMAEQVKKTDIAIRPGISDTAAILRPKAKDMNIKAGYITPMSTTGPFE
jgi:hypothetical protein